MNKVNRNKFAMQGHYFPCLAQQNKDYRLEWRVGKYLPYMLFSAEILTQIYFYKYLYIINYCCILNGSFTQFRIKVSIKDQS